MNIKKMFFKKENPIPAAGPARRILAIEDDPGLRATIQKVLEKNGYVVVLAETGERGLELARREKPNLILLDVVMPGLRGDEVCRRLKMDPATKEIPVIFLTSLDTPQDVIEHYDLGADVHLTKPINSKELIAQVKISLNEK